MSLIGALNLGSSAIAVQQAALQVTGNNIANAGNADYTRETSNISPSPDQQVSPGIFVGTGVNLTSIQRQINDSLEARLRSSDSDSQAAQTSQDFLSRVESTFNALGDNNLSSQMSKFFGDWSNLASTPQDIGLRQVVLQDGDGLAQTFNQASTSLSQIQSDVQTQLTGQANAANGLADQVAQLNGQIATAEGGGSGQDNTLRDQRDAVLKKLANLVDIKTVPQDNGTTNVYVGSVPLVIGTTNEGIAVKQDLVNGKPQDSLVFKSNNGPMNATSGELGALVNMQQQVSSVNDQLNSLAHNLMFELNKLHAAGQGLSGISSLTAASQVTDPTAALNTSGAGLAFTPSNGSFVVHVTDKTTGVTTSTLVPVDLDGLNSNDTTLNSLAGSLSAIPGVSASITGGKLQISAASGGQELSFSQDSSGVLAALGVNTFYTGKDASDMAVSATVASDPGMIAAARNGDKADNQTALAIAALAQQPLAGLSGSTLDNSYQGIVNGIAGQVANAKTNADAAQAVQDTLSAQHDALSGVSLDEEAVNLMRQQRAFQGAAKLITTVDDLMQTILNMVP
jgi:flagellar hook-associated protein 1 FlgK